MWKAIHDEAAVVNARQVVAATEDDSPEQLHALRDLAVALLRRHVSDPGEAVERVLTDLVIAADSGALRTLIGVVESRP